MFATPEAVIGHATNVTLDPDDPDYEWVDEGMVVRSTPSDDPTYVAIDPNVAIDESGDRSLVWGSFWDGIVLQRVDDATGKLMQGEPRHNLAVRDPWWQGVEAPHLVQRDGWWYLVVSFGFCCSGVNSTYSTHVGRSRSITGPYVDASGQPMLENGGTLLVGTYDNVIGPGHGAVVEDDGDWLYAHHYYDGDNGGTPTLSIRPLYWDEDGWPVAADPGFMPGTPEPTEVSGVWQLDGYPQECSARPPIEATIRLRADGSVQPSGSWQLDGDVVRVEDVGVDGDQRDWWWFVDQDGQRGFGRDDRTAAVRAARAGNSQEIGATVGECSGIPDGQPPTPPAGRPRSPHGPGTPDSSAAVPVSGVPTLTG